VSKCCQMTANAFFPSASILRRVATASTLFPGCERERRLVNDLGIEFRLEVSKKKSTETDPYPPTLTLALRLNFQNKPSDRTIFADNALTRESNSHGGSNLYETLRC